MNMNKQALTVVKKPNLPTLQELYSDREASVRQNELNIILNSQPKEEWIKSHPFVKNLKYIPVERIEYLLTMIFGKWRVEVKEVKVLANSIVVSVRLMVQNPLNQEEWDYQDGVGAAPIQTKAGSSPIDFANMTSSAIQIGAPAAESYAIKDAAEKFGRIFGKDLNRKDTVAYVDRLHESIAVMNKMTVIEQIEKVQSLNELKILWLTLSQSEREDVDILQAKEEKKNQYENSPSGTKKPRVARTPKNEDNGDGLEKGAGVKNS